jgi:hypothetical protein
MSIAMGDVVDSCLTNEQAHNRAMEVLLATVGLVRCQAVLSEAVIDYRKHELGGTELIDNDNCERAFAFGPDLLVRARKIEREYHLPRASGLSPTRSEEA